MSEPANADTCGGLDNVNDGCGVCFPSMAPGGGLCLLCKKVKQPGLSTDEIEKILVSASTCWCYNVYNVSIDVQI
jgi:hypothetical protein